MKTITAGGDMSQQHVEALTLAGWDFKVFPLNGKVPMFNEWQHKATREISQVDAWWYRWPQANIGAKVFDWHVVVDIDPRNGGDETWKALLDGRELPTTLTTRTGSGGLHIWFKLPYARAVKGTAGPGVDLKSSTGYMVMPGSYHPTTGGLYVCEQWAAPAMLPTWLEKHIYKPVPKPAVVPIKTPGKTGTGLVNAVATAVEGQRNQMLFWASCRAFEDRLTITEDLRAAALSIGLPEQEIDRTINSAEQAVKGAAA